VGKYHSTQYKPFTSPLFFLGWNSKKVRS
jgi:hypothetical protein